MEPVVYPELEGFASNRGGILVVGHGTRLVDGQRQFLSLVDQMQQQVPNVAIQSAFLELASPTIEQAVEQLQAQGITQILVVPILLFSAAHAQEDIPDAVRDACDRFNVEVIGQVEPLDCSPHAIDLSLLRYQQAIACSNSSGCLFAGHCTQAQTCCRPIADLAEIDFNVARVMVGRGTSDASARQRMRDFVEILGRFHRPSWSAVGFFAGDKNGVEDTILCAATESSSKTIVIHPHLLFEGHLTNELRRIVTEMQSKFPSKRWLIAMPLGIDQSLAEVWLEMADEYLASTTNNHSA